PGRSYSELLPEPLDGLRETLVECCARAPPEERLGAGRVEDTAPLLAGLRRGVLGGAIYAGQARQAPVQLVDRRLGACADIRDAGRVRERHPAGDRVGNIPDVDVVARLLPVAVDDARFAGEKSRREDGTDAGLARRVLARAVDVRQA